MNFFLSVVAFTSLFSVSFADTVWLENTSLDSGKTCSTGERETQFGATLAVCKEKAEELGYSYIYYQSSADRDGDDEWCHIYSSCTNTRNPSLGGTNYRNTLDCIDSDGDACDGCLGKGFNCNTKTYDQCDDVTVDGANWCGSTEDCIDNDGDNCDGCLGSGGNCNPAHTYTECLNVEVNGANWCGGECIDNDGNACDVCLGSGGNCNDNSKSDCKDAEVNGANWCGGA